MEEKKLKTEGTSKSTKPEQPTYEQLKDWCNQLLTQRNQLGQRLNQLTNVVNKLPWLFEVLKSKDLFEKDFVQKCIDEIEFIMYPPEEELKDEEVKGEKE